MKLFVLAALAVAAGNEGEAEAVKPAPAAGIIIHVTQARSVKGIVRCALYDTKNAKAFPTDSTKALRGTTAAVKDGKATCIFSDVGAGEYAVAAFHDEDNNDKLKTGFLGIPKEGIASSNDAPARFGPPKFKDAKFAFAPPLFEQSIKLDY